MACVTEPFIVPKPERPPVRRLWREAVHSVTPISPREARRALSAAPRGDGHPVLVVPAFLHADWRTLPLRRFLRECGYAVYGWELGVNIGPTDAVLRGI